MGFIKVAAFFISIIMLLILVPRVVFATPACTGNFVCRLIVSTCTCFHGGSCNSPSDLGACGGVPSDCNCVQGCSQTQTTSFACSISATCNGECTVTGCNVSSSCAITPDACTSGGSCGGGACCAGSPTVTGAKTSLRAVTSDGHARAGSASRTIPAATVWRVAESIRMKLPVSRLVT
jgi:hypothetical protein